MANTGIFKVYGLLKLSQRYNKLFSFIYENQIYESL